MMISVMHDCFLTLKMSLHLDNEEITDEANLVRKICGGLEAEILKEVDGVIRTRKQTEQTMRVLRKNKK